jgi:hypothetical protein
MFSWLVLDYRISCLYIGHGGPGAAYFLQNNLFKSLIMHPKFTTDKKTAIGIYYSNPRLRGFCAGAFID